MISHPKRDLGVNQRGSHQMDVLTRQSYVAAGVLPGERTFASGLTDLARNLFWAIGSSVAGLVMRNVTFSAPLVIGGGTKVAYDLAEYRAFREIRPPEELEACATYLAWRRLLEPQGSEGCAARIQRVFRFCH